VPKQFYVTEPVCYRRSDVKVLESIERRCSQGGSRSRSGWLFYIRRWPWSAFSARGQAVKLLEMSTCLTLSGAVWPAASYAKPRDRNADSGRAETGTK